MLKLHIPLPFRYGNEDKLVTLMGVLQALVSFVQDNDDNIRYFEKIFCLLLFHHVYNFSFNFKIFLYISTRKITA